MSRNFHFELLAPQRKLNVRLESVGKTAWPRTETARLLAGRAPEMSIPAVAVVSQFRYAERNAGFSGATIENQGRLPLTALPGNSSRAYWGSESPHGYNVN